MPVFIRLQLFLSMKKRLKRRFCVLKAKTARLEPAIGSTALFRTLTRVLFAACSGATLQADFLTMWCGRTVSFWWDGLGGADVGFDSDFLGHDGLRVRKGKPDILSQSAQRQIYKQILRL